MVRRPALLAAARSPDSSSICRQRGRISVPVAQLAGGAVHQSGADPVFQPARYRDTTGRDRSSGALAAADWLPRSTTVTNTCACLRTIHDLPVL